MHRLLNVSLYQNSLALRQVNMVFRYQASRCLAICSMPQTNDIPTIIYCTTEFVFPIRTLYALLKSVGWNRALGDTAVGDIRRDKLGNENQVGLIRKGPINIQNQIHLDHSYSKVKRQSEATKSRMQEHSEARKQVMQQTAVPAQQGSQDFSKSGLDFIDCEFNHHLQ